MPSEHAYLRHHYKPAQAGAEMLKLIMSNMRSQKVFHSSIDLLLAGVDSIQ
jgi:hypothetical protein